MTAGARGMPLREGLEVWVLYLRPADFPHSYVLRRQVVRRDSSGASVIVPDPLPLVVALVSDAGLEACRSAVPWGAVQVQWPGDDPDDVIYEVWV